MTIMLSVAFLLTQPEISVIDSIDLKAIRPQERQTFLDRKHHAREVEMLLWERGYRDRHAILAIHANMWHESRFNPNAVSGNFVGLFQIGGRGTMGAGTSVADRQSIPTAVQIVASKPYFISWYKDVKAKKLSARDAATTFASKVLRCASKHVGSRGSTARTWKRGM